ncbi:SR Protein Kinase [Carabus blaptoides fortunei]
MVRQKCERALQAKTVFDFIGRKTSINSMEPFEYMNVTLRPEYIRVGTCTAPPLQPPPVHYKPPVGTYGLEKIRIVFCILILLYILYRFLLKNLWNYVTHLFKLHKFSGDALEAKDRSVHDATSNQNGSTTSESVNAAGDDPATSKVDNSVKSRKKSRSCPPMIRFRSEPRQYSGNISGVEIEDYEEVDAINYSDGEQEDPKDYCRGGYYPVKIGEIFNDRYKVIRKLGWGHFSTVWLCEDTTNRKYVAIKVVKSASSFMETAIDEIKLLKWSRCGDPSDVKRGKTVLLLDDFRIKSINGTHICMVFEVLGKSLLHLIVQNSYHGLPVPVIKAIIRQVIEGLDYLHTKCDIIHTDIKPENILLVPDSGYVDKLAAEATEWHKMGLKLPKSFVSTLRSDCDVGKETGNNDRLKIETSSNDNSSNNSTITSTAEEHSSEDFWTNERPRSDSLTKEQLISASALIKKRKNSLEIKELSSDVKIKIVDLGNGCFDYHHYCEDIQTRQYRSPEVLLGARYSFPADMWSTACVAFELATGEYLFNPHASPGVSTDEEHLALIAELVGEIPKYVAFSGKYSQHYFRKNGSFRHIKELKVWKLVDVLIEKYNWNPMDAKQFADFLLPMLEVDPAIRATAAECLRHPWLHF